VAELSPDRMKGRGAPVLVLGMPFDPKGRPPSTHLAHAKNFNDDDASGGVVWQPAYLSDRAMKDLGTLVRIDFLLAGSGERLNEAARMLSASDREQARAVLRSQQSALHQRIRACIETAYGIRNDNDGCIGTPVPPEDRLVSLQGAFVPQMPVGADMKGAVTQLLDRWFEYRYPAHPVFDTEVRDAVLRRVLERVQAAAQEPDQRQFIEDTADRRHLGAIAVPLKLAVMSQTHLQLTNDWANHFATMHARTGGGPLTVAKLRGWIDEPKPMGLPTRVQNLVILAFAAQADRAPVRNGAPAQISLERIDDTVELREEALPDETTWAKARERAAALFGLKPGEVRKGATLSALAAELQDKGAAKRTLLADLLRELRPWAEKFGIAPTAPRFTTMRSAQALLGDLAGAATPLARVEALADAELTTSEAAVGRLLAALSEIREAVASADWNIIEAGTGLGDHRKGAAEGLRAKLDQMLDADEHALQLKPVLRDVQTRASRLLAETRPTDGSPPGGGPPPPPPPPPGEEVVDERQQVVLDAPAATAAIDELRGHLVASPGARLTISWRLTRPRSGGAA